jgi:Na+:H+ antiporter, NhaA family
MSNVSPHPPGTWKPAHRAARLLAQPIERFLQVEAASGIVLCVATVVALVWANLPGSHSYEAVWHFQAGVSLGALTFVHPLHFWINEGLMTLFFFVVGLEIRSEIHEGELSSPKRATLPALAAVGGMVVPALLYASINHDRAAAGGWGVPMATDIAFAVGVLTLLGKRVPAPLRVLLLAVAVIDDIGAILVIALFYSSDVSFVGLEIVGGCLGVVVLLRKLGVRSGAVYAAPALGMWLGFLRAGIHPTLCGVALGLVTPVRTWFGRRGFAETAREAASAVEEARDPHVMHAILERMKLARREAVAPVERLRESLHLWVAFVIMPLFALANAGVRIGGADELTADSLRASSGVVLGLVLGKPLGILLFAAVGLKLRVVELPKGVGWPGLVVLGAVAGIGFTMAIFIADLAFADPAMLAASKLAVLVASFAAALVGSLAGRTLLGVPETAPHD